MFLRMPQGKIKLVLNNTFYFWEFFGITIRCKGKKILLGSIIKVFSMSI